MNDFTTQKYKAYFHYENVPNVLRDYGKEEFMKNRNIAARVFNNCIDDINKEWNKTGKPAAFGEFLEDINPEYIEFIRERIQPKLDEAISIWSPVRIIIDTYGDLIGTFRVFEKSKIWMDLEPI